MATNRPGRTEKEMMVSRPNMVARQNSTVVELVEIKNYQLEYGNGISKN